MEMRETAAVLAMISALDSRKVYGEIDAQAWHAVVGDLRFEDCRDAVIAHYQQSPHAITPADLRAKVIAVRKTRIGDRVAPLPPVDPEDTESYKEWQREWYRAIGDGQDTEEAEQSADLALGIARKTLPQAHRDVNYGSLVRGVPDDS
jgi:hypothetical protein